MQRTLAFTLLLLAGIFSFEPLRVGAQSAAPAPTKIDVAPLRTQNPLGENVPVQVQLLDANGRPVSAQRNFNAEVQVDQPSGQTSTYSVNFAPGESAKQIAIPIGEAGVAKLTVRQQEQQLIGGSNFVLVRPPRAEAAGQGHQQVQAKKKVAKKPLPDKGPGARLQGKPLWQVGQVHLILAAYFPPQGPTTPPAPATGQLMLTVSGEDANGGTRADGKTCAHVQVFYLPADDPPRDIQIWMSQSNGDLDNQFVVIHKGSASGAACWTSESPIAAATLSVSDPPGYTFAPRPGGGDPRQVTHKFTDDIVGIEFANAPQSISIVDNFNLVAQFKGRKGPVRLSDKREVHFSADTPLLNLTPLQAIVDVGGFDSSTLLVPTSFGRSTVQVFTPDYRPATAVIVITWIGVLIACLLGGSLGGFLAWINSQGKLWIRIVTGLIAGLVASWAYVIVGLPKVQTAFLHNRLSVFFVALIVGLTGVKGITTIATKFGLPTF